MSVFSLFINWVCAIVFTLIGFSCYKSKEPVGFYSGIQVRREQVTDVRKYNLCNVALWMSFALFFWIAGFCSIFSVSVGMIFTIMGCTAGIIFLIVGYGFIKRRFFIEYHDKYIAGKLNDYK